MLYLTGFEEPGSCLVIEKNFDSVNTFLFVKDNDLHSMLWEGPRTGVDRAAAYFGVDKALPSSDLPEFLRSHLAKKGPIYHDLDSNSVLPDDAKSMLALNGSSITPVIQKMRVLKRSEEAKLMLQGCKKSAEAFKETMSWSMINRISGENGIAAKFEYECRIRGATGLAYVPVVASGPRSLILHYTRNNMVGMQNDLMFMDAGGKFDGYCTDISRAWPVSGKFTIPQREIYDAVLKVQQACISLTSAHKKDHVSLDVLNAFSAYLMIDELGKLGFKNPAKCVERLYPHSIGHYLGLDLHDCPLVRGDVLFKPGMVITIEPGLYISADPEFPPQYHGIGVRIEDDILITEDGCTVMTDGVPKDIGEIEHLAG